MKKLMAIVNCTPDSYFDGGQGNEIKRAYKMIEEGADILDIGGESTRPGFTPISPQEELSRVLPVIRALKNFTLSIDTTKPEVAKAALNEGVDIINDVNGFADPKMRRLAREWKVPIVVMHGIKHEGDLISQMYHFFERRIALLLDEGIDPSQIILDPGIGFGKGVMQNLEVLKNLKSFRGLGYPLLIGLSRKSFMQKILNKSVAEVLPSTLALNMMAMLEGVGYIRVHDVREHRDILTLLENLDRV